VICEAELWKWKKLKDRDVKIHQVRKNVHLCTYLFIVYKYVQESKDINDNVQFSVDVFFGRAQIGLLWLTLDTK
jgi:hypothetical protein